MTECSHCGFVAIVGRPNVGKSTLLNRLLGQKLAITSPKPQTTRHAILGVKTRADGQICFVDTPGLHQRDSRALGRYLNRAASAALAQTDVALFVVEALRWNAEDQRALDLVAAAGVPAIAVINKVDRTKDKSALLPYLQELGARHAFVALIPVSAAKGTQLETLETRVIEALPLAAPLFPEDQITDRSERFFAAELVREQLMRRYAEELPYQTSVEIERFEDVDGRYHINALIWVERDNQKAIVIGRDGEALKAVATLARQEMQKLFERPVHLEVWVKVKKSWSSDEASLASLGYRDDV